MVQQTLLKLVCSARAPNRRYIYSAKRQQLRKAGFCCSRTCKVITPGRTFTAFTSTHVCQKQPQQPNNLIHIASLWETQPCNVTWSSSALKDWPKDSRLVFCGHNEVTDRERPTITLISNEKIYWFSVFYIIENLISIDFGLAAG